LGKRRLSIDPDKGVQMIRHEQQQIEIPSRPFMINTRCVHEHCSRFIMAKLIPSTSLTANRDEIDCAETPGKMRGVIQSFPHNTGHPAIISAVGVRR